MTTEMTVGKKFALTSGGLVVVMVVVGAFAVYNLAGLNHITQLIVTDPMPGMASIAAVRSATFEMRATYGKILPRPTSPIR